MSLEREVIDAIRQTGQSRYEREAPSPESIHSLEGLRIRLKQHVNADNKNVAYLAMLADIEESLLNYESAIKCLQKIVELGGGKQKAIRKRLAILKGRRNTKPLFPIQESDYMPLQSFLLDNGVADLEHRITLEHTECWLLEHSVSPDCDSILQNLETAGLHSDFQLLAKLNDLIG